jgi:hypothetical protein
VQQRVRTPPEQGHPLQRATACALAGMEFAIPGTQRCEHGHVDLDGAVLPLDELRRCPLKEEDGTCGWVVSYYWCTCVSRERAVASHSAAFYWTLFGVFLFFGVAVCAMNIFATRNDLGSSNWSGDGSCGPGCDCSEDGTCRFWAVFTLFWMLPISFLVGAFWNLYRALLTAEESVEYWKGCGYMVRALLARHASICPLLRPLTRSPTPPCIRSPAYPLTCIPPPLDTPLAGRTY